MQSGAWTRTGAVFGLISLMVLPAPATAKGPMKQPYTLVVEQLGGGAGPQEPKAPAELARFLKGQLKFEKPLTEAEAKSLFAILEPLKVAKGSGIDPEDAATSPGSFAVTRVVLRPEDASFYLVKIRARKR